MKRVMLKQDGHWIRGTTHDGRTEFAADDAKIVLHAAQAHGHSAYIADVVDPKASLEHAKRALVIRDMEWAVKHEPQIHYSQGSNRMEGIGHPHKLPLHADCSSLATLLCNWSGLPDPNGLHYNGTGYTGTLLAHLHHIHAGQVQPADLVVFGPGDGHHVAMVDHAMPNGDWMLVSHGQERGPLYIEHSAEARFQGGGWRWLQLPVGQAA